MNQSYGRTNPPCHRPTGEDKLAPKIWVDELFARFANIYKTQWTELIPTAAIEVSTKYDWAKALYDLSYQQIKGTIDWCGLNQKYVPSPPEFRQLVLNPYPGRTHHEAYKDFRPYKLLTKQRNLKIGEEHIAKMRQITAKSKIR